MYLFIVAFIILLNAYIGKLLQREFHDFSYRERQVLLGSYNHNVNVSILTRAQFVPKRFVRRVADHFTLKHTINLCRKAAHSTQETYML